MTTSLVDTDEKVKIVVVMLFGEVLRTQFGEYSPYLFK